jgi:ribosomal protein S18 acetylase RimI-like enzyme
MTKPEAFIRKARTGDLEAIGKLWCEFMDFHSARDPHFSRSEEGEKCFKEFIAKHIAAGDSCVLVAESGGEVVGYLLASLTKNPPVLKERDYGTISDLAVAGRCRRMDIGGKMYREALLWFAERGVRRIELRVAATNEVSTAFWQKNGFTPYAVVLSKNI